MLRKIRKIAQREGPSAVARRAMAKLRREMGVSYDEAVARRKRSYGLGMTFRPTKLTPRLGAAALADLSVEQCIPQQVAQHYLDHRFDLLGSGWVQVRYGMHCRGMAGYRYDMGATIQIDSRGHWLAGRVNPSNLSYAQKVWKRVDPEYTPMDWQLDFKSGYRWPEKTWAARLKYGHRPGVDVKVPWELARMQHLPQMALRAAALGGAAPEALHLARDIRNQLLDFIATNPPGFGVNWMCPMDIAIRGANWCLTWDILQAAGMTMDKSDEVVLALSLYDHGSYIVRHLEWSPTRANHYLADICGLVFIATYLPETEETDRWLAFATGQVQVETIRQFLPDGGNFEGSTAYHRLSTEMLVYATALILGLSPARLRRLTEIDPLEYRYLPKEAGLPMRLTLYETGKTDQGTPCATPFETGFVERLHRAVAFFAAILKPDGTFPQIGDNDSGRFFKVAPLYEVMTVGEAKRKYLNLDRYEELEETEPYFFEDGLNGFHLLRAAATLGILYPRYILHDRLISTKDSIEHIVIAALTKGHSFCWVEKLSGAPETVSDGEKPVAFLRHWDAAVTRPDVIVYSYPLPERSDSAKPKITIAEFHDFGCFIFKHPAWYLLIRCIVKPEHKIGGHFHDDQLNIELEIDGQPLVRDPGTFVYTALPGERNRYRSATAHFPSNRCISPLPGKSGVFDVLIIQCAKVEFCGSYGFAAHFITPDRRCELLARFGSHAIQVACGNSGFVVPGDNVNQPSLRYSPGHGILERNAA